MEPANASFAARARALNRLRGAEAVNRRLQVRDKPANTTQLAATIAEVPLACGNVRRQRQARRQRIELNTKARHDLSI
jgi:hypothetical protein